MLSVKPFFAIRPARNHESRIASVPYDVVSTDEARALAADNPESFLHVVRSEIDLPADTDPYDARVYERARVNFQRLLDRGIMIRDDEPHMFIYRLVWKHHTQAGLVCCCHLSDYEQNRIRKHEKTRRVKEDDRTRHVLAVNANTGPVFLTYRDREEINELMRSDMNARPLYHFVAAATAGSSAPVDNVTHTIWPVADSSRYVDAFASIECAYVADGHHRAASAARAARERSAANARHTGEEEYNWFLAALFPAGQLTILPYNRIVRDLNGMTPEEALGAIGRAGRVVSIRKAEPAAAADVAFFLGDTWRSLHFDRASIDPSDPIASMDVALLQDRVLGPIFGIDDPRTSDRVDFIGGIRGTGHLERLVRSGQAGIAFSLFPTSVEQLMRVADAGLVMPPKSTWFEPKLRSGLLVHSLD